MTQRRTVLQGTAGAAVLTAFGGSVLSACTTEGQQGPDSSTDSVKPPTFVAYKGIAPDLPGELPGTEGFLSYPPSPSALVADKPGKGGSVSALIKSLGALPPAMNKNRYWQELNTRLGTEMDMLFTPSANYESKFATTIAGGDLPDLIEVAPPVPQLPKLLESNFQDLSEYLSGDAVKEYPFLANIATQAWKTCLVDGRLYGIPVPRPVLGNALFRRDDLIAAKGLDPDPKNFVEFEKLCRELTDSKANVWALTASPYGLLGQMLRLPATWRNDGGKLTHLYEFPEVKQALTASAKMIADGLVHPDFATNTVSKGKQLISAGTTLMHSDGFSAWGEINRTAGGQVGAIVPFGVDSADPIIPIQAGSLNFTVLKKASEQRVKEILAIFNWLAAPFGSQEYLFRKFGLDGLHYTMTNGNPVRTELGTTEVTGTNGIIEYHLADGPKVLFSPGLEEATRKANAYAQKIASFTEYDPTVGLYSDTSSQKGAQLEKNVAAARLEIIQGRKPVSAWDDAVKAWRTGGGDQIRAEFEEQLQQKGD